MNYKIERPSRTLTLISLPVFLAPNYPPCPRPPPTILAPMVPGSAARSVSRLRSAIPRPPASFEAQATGWPQRGDREPTGSPKGKMNCPAVIARVGFEPFPPSPWIRGGGVAGATVAATDVAGAGWKRLPSPLSRPARVLAWGESTGWWRWATWFPSLSNLRASAGVVGERRRWKGRGQEPRRAVAACPRVRPCRFGSGAHDGWRRGPCRPASSRLRTRTNPYCREPVGGSEIGAVDTPTQATTGATGLRHAVGIVPLPWCRRFRVKASLPRSFPAKASQPPTVRGLTIPNAYVLLLTMTVHVR